MNTQLQRMIIILFLALTLMAVTLLFWLPVNNDSERILVARESPLESLTESFADNTEISDPLGEEEIHEDLLAEDAELRREYEPADYVGASNVEAEDINSIGKEVASVGKSVAGDYAHDVMGNQRTHVLDHTVRKNDWFSTITGKYWDDLFMWPDLYTMNTQNLRSSNPDLIFPGETVRVYESLTADGKFSEEDRRTLLRAYLEIYQVYKQLGDGKALAAARLLASAVRYDKDFLEKYPGIITPEDKQVAQRLVGEQRFLD